MNTLSEDDPICTSATLNLIAETWSDDGGNEFSICTTDIAEHLEENDIQRLEELRRQYREEYVPYTMEQNY